MAERAGGGGRPDVGDVVTWAVLLSRWTDFAQAAVAVPADEDGERWRRSVAPIVGLQAVTMALGELGRLPAGERGVGADRAAVLVRQHASELHSAWGREPLPGKVAELIEDARQALETAEWLGVEWVVSRDGGTTVPVTTGWAEEVTAAGFGGDVLAAPGGTRLGRGAPTVFVRGEPPAGVDDGVLREAGLERSPGLVPPRQVYRVIDAGTGRPTHDLVAPLLTGLPAGQPMLVTVVESGRVVRREDEGDAAARVKQQRALLGEGGVLEVRGFESRE